jgi:hypothetical protein
VTQSPLPHRIDEQQEASLLIVAAATVFAVFASGTTSTPIELTAFNVTISPTPLALFLAGALSVALLGLGFILITRGTRRTARKRRELKELRKENASATTRATAEREGAGAAERPAEPSVGKTAEEAADRASTGTATSRDSEASSGSAPEDSTGKRASGPSDQGPAS